MLTYRQVHVILGIEEIVPESAAKKRTQEEVEEGNEEEGVTKEDESNDSNGTPAKNMKMEENWMSEKQWLYFKSLNFWNKI